MSISFDFTIVNRTQVDGISLIVAQNETAYNYLAEEACLSTFTDGSAPLASDRVGDFISDAAHAHLCCDYR